MRKIYCAKCKTFLKNLKYHIFGIKHYFFLVFVVSVELKMKKKKNEEESVEILKIFGLINRM